MNVSVLLIFAWTRAPSGAVFWVDEIGLRSDDVRGRGYAPQGRTPTVRVPCRRAGLGLVSAAVNKGSLRWTVLDDAVEAPDLVRFPGRLVRDVGRKVFLILAWLPIRSPRTVRAWLAGREAEITVFHLSPCSRELNPDEGVVADRK